MLADQVNANLTVTMMAVKALLESDRRACRKLVDDTYEQFHGKSMQKYVDETLEFLLPVGIHGSGESRNQEAE